MHRSNGKGLLKAKINLLLKKLLHAMTCLVRNYDQVTLWGYFLVTGLARFITEPLSSFIYCLHLASSTSSSTGVFPIIFRYAWYPLDSMSLFSYKYLLFSLLYLLSLIQYLIYSDQSQNSNIPYTIYHNWYRQINNLFAIYNEFFLP